MKAQGFRQGAGDAPAPQVGFGGAAMNGQGLIPDGHRLPFLLFGFAALGLGIAGQFGGVGFRQLAVALHNAKAAQGVQNIGKGAARLAMGQKPPVA